MKARIAIIIVGLLAAIEIRAYPIGSTLIGTVFDIDTTTTNLYKISTTTGSATWIGFIGSGSYIGLGTDSNGNVYGYVSLTSTTGIFQSIDPTTGAPIQTTPLSVSMIEGGLDIDNGTTAYATDRNGSLVSFSIFGGPVSVLGPTLYGTSPVDIDGLAVDLNNHLYGIGQFNNQLYAVSGSGALTPIGSSTLPGGIGRITGGLAFRADGDLFSATGGVLYSFGGGTSGNALGARTSIGSLGLPPNHVITGLTFIPGQASAVPEPSALALVGAGLLGLAFLRRRDLQQSNLQQFDSDIVCLV